MPKYKAYIAAVITTEAKFVRVWAKSKKAAKLLALNPTGIYGSETTEGTNTFISISPTPKTVEVFIAPTSEKERGR